MTATLIVSLITCVGLIVLVLVKPSVRIKNADISIYWLAPLIGAGALIVSGLIPFKEMWAGLTQSESINPLKILVLFISMTVLSIFLDEVGFFAYLANAVLKKSKTSQKSLFFYLYITVSVLTVFTSNDIIVLTFTPFICYFAKNARISPVPFLVAEFVAANTWSMFLIIGNPTNIYLATANGIGFIDYFLVMALPTVLAGLTALLILYLLFKKTLSAAIDPVINDIKIADKGMLIIGLVHLGLCTVLLILSSYINFEMWLVSLIFFISLFITALSYALIKKTRPKTLVSCLKRAPWELIPFVISMFVLVLALDKYNVTGAIGAAFGESFAILKYGVASFMSANLINNIPMSVFFSSVIQTLDISIVQAQAVYATVIGSNIGAFLTPLGALAGIMWSGILKKHEVKFTFLSFVKYGLIVAVPTMAAALGGLYISFLFF